MSSAVYNGERGYLEMLENVIKYGDKVDQKEERTNTGTLSSLFQLLEFDLEDGFPLYITKKINFSNIIGELLWMLSGNTSLMGLRKYQDKNYGAHTIWSDDFEKYGLATGQGNCNQYGGRIYGKQWRNFNCLDLDGNPNTHDQLEELLMNMLRVNMGDPTMARRLIMTAWNPYDHTVGDKKCTALPACHTDFQVIIRNGKLNLRFSMRSNDLMLGNPYNVAFYAALVHILCAYFDLQPGKLACFITDAHIYANHIEGAKEQISRKYAIGINNVKLEVPHFENFADLFEMTAKDFKITGYNPMPFIKLPQAS